MTVIEKDQNKTILQSCLSTDKTRILCNNKGTAVSLSQQTRVVAAFSQATPVCLLCSVHILNGRH